jgi:prophage antirepressor-like protein
MKTTAASLLDLVFEGHSIRTVIRDGKPLACAKDIATAIGLSKYRDAISSHLDSDETRLVSISTGQQVREVSFLTETGIAALVMCSRKPAARRFRRWMLGEVLPQLLTYGSYLPGATPAERLQALNRRVQQERAACVASSQATLTESGLMTLRAFRLEHAIPPQDILPIARRLQLLAAADGTAPVKLTLPGHANPANAWPRPLLAAAVNSTQPRLF